MGFVENYIAHIPESEVPEVWHPWMALFALAAVAGEKVWFDNGGRLLTDIYILMVGPSGTGKDTAAKPMLALLRALNNDPFNKETYGRTRDGRAITESRVAYYLDGVITRAGLHEELIKHPQMSVIATEMLNAYGHGDNGQEFLRAMTSYYNSADREIRERTRSHGNLNLSGRGSLCINWLVGTTLDWLRPMAQLEHLRGGLLGRMLIVQGEPTDRRVPRRRLLEDHAKKQEALQSHLQAIADSERRVLDLTKEASTLQHQWYMDRRKPDDPDLDSFWHRENDNTLKIAMLLALSDDPQTSKIKSKHWLRAHELVGSVLAGLDKLINDLANNPQAQALRLVREHVKRAGRLSTPALYKRMQRYGLWTRQVDSLVYELKESGLVYTLEKGEETHIVWKESDQT